MIDYKVLATSQRHRPLADFWRGRFAILDREFPVTPPDASAAVPRQSIAIALSDASVQVLDTLADDPLGRVTVLTAALVLLLSRHFDRGTIVLRTPLLTDAGEPALNPDRELPLVFSLAADATRRQLLQHVAEIVEDSYSCQDFPLRAMLADERGAALDAIGDCSLSCAAVHQTALSGPSPLHFNCDEIADRRITVEWDPAAIDSGLVTGLAAQVADAPAALADLTIAVRDAGAATPGTEDLAVIRGFRVELSLVARALRACEGVRDAAVVADDTDAGRELIAYVIAGGALDTSALHGCLSRTLPASMIPSAFIVVAALPLTPDGRVDREQLPARGAAARSSRPYVSPRGREEQALVRIWQDVFRLDHVGVGDDFFELGGHSLRAMQMMMRIQQDLGVEVSLNDMFRSPTIAKLAAVIRQAAPSALEPIRPLPPAEHYAVSHGQQRLWILNQVEEHAATYNVATAFELAGLVDAAALERAFTRLVERHESLRTTFLFVDGEPRQRIHPPAPFVLPALDVSTASDPGARAREAVRADAMAPFDLVRGPLMRATLVTLAPARHVLSLSLHHIVTDEWSFDVLIEDLVELYRRERLPIVEPMAPLPIQYKEFAAWQRAALTSGAAEPHRRYWMDALSGELPPLDLPADFPRPGVKTNAGSRHRFGIDAATTAKLKALGASRGASLFITLVALVKTLLHRSSGQEEIRVGIPIAGRKQIELADQIGFYLNTLVLRDRLRAGDTFETVLAGVTATATGAYDHDLYPFDRLVEELGAVRDLGRLRLFDVLVVQGNTSAPNPGLPDLAVSAFDIPVDVSKFDLSFHFDEQDGGLQVELQYDTDLFLPDRIARLGGNFETLVASVLAAPATAIGALEIGALQPSAVDHTATAPGAIAKDSSARRFVAPATAAEAALAAIWSEVLGVANVGVRDNFFELGGDSIIALQIVSRTGKAGLQLSLKQLFRHPTIAELAVLATPTRVEDPLVESGALDHIPVAPIARSFFDLQWTEPSHFNQAVLLEVPADVDAGRLRRVVDEVFARHEALRLRFARAGHEWVASVDAEAAAVVFAVEPLPDSPALTRRCEDLQRTLNISEGPLARVVFFESSDGRTGRLLLVVHHLAVDGVSWRILLEELSSAYQQLAPRDRIALPAPTMSYRTWMHRLQAWSDSPAAQQDAEYWSRSSGGRPDVFPADLSSDPSVNAVGSEDHVSIRLDKSETAALLKQVPRAYNTQINDVLLTALAIAISAHTGQPAISMDLEGHGRQDPAGDADVSRTVGWFTSVFPVTFTVTPAAQPGDILKAVKETLRGVPSHGTSFGALRYLTRDLVLRGRMAALPPPAIRFNYLGQTDAIFHGGPWQPATESTGAAHSPLGRRGYLLDIIAVVSGGCLEVEWISSRACHRRETVAALAGAFAEALRAVIAHCIAPGAGGFTPSDFPAATVTQTDLDRLVRQVDADRGRTSRIADIYDLTPMQQGLLFHSVVAEEQGVYIEQWACGITGALDTERLRRAWLESCARHTVLRTAFFWAGLEQPVQVVFDDIDLPWERLDWRDASEAEQAVRLRVFLEQDRRRGLDLTRAPLMRCTAIRTADEAHTLCWTSHHILMDGWSQSIVLRDVIAAYERGAENDRAQPPARPFRSYVEWLRARDQSRAEAYWRTRFEGVTTPTILPAGAQRDRPDDLLPLLQRRLSAATTSALALFGRRHHLTMNTLVSGAWALVLGSAAGSLDIVCGATLAGRPPELDGAESMVGLFINTLPVRFQIDPREPVIGWLRRVQSDQADLDQFADSSLVKVQRFTGVPRGLPLFESIIVFENYPVARAIETGDSGLVLTEVVVHDQTNYPLTFAIVPDDELLLRLSYDGGRYGASDADAMITRVETVLAAFLGEPTQRVDALLSQLGMTAAPAPATAEWRASLDAETTAAVRALAARQAASVATVLHALAAALHLRYSAHEEIVAVVDSMALEREATLEDDSIESLIARSLTRVEHAGGAGAAPPDLVFAFPETGDGIAVSLHCTTGRFDEQALRRAHGHLRELALGAAWAPAVPIARANLLPARERTQLLDLFNATAKDWGASLTIVELFERQAAQHPDRIAVRAATALTYGELNARANQLARRLVTHHGVGPDVLVGVMAERSLDMVVALLAVLKAGGAYVPLDPEYPADRLAFMIEDSGAAVMLTQETFRAMSAAFSGSRIFVDSEWPAISREAAGDLPPRAASDNLAYMIYTSGSTGRPKGAMNTHGAIANRLLWMQEAFGLTADDRVLQKTPFSFDVSVWEFFWPLMTGAQLVMAEPGAHGDTGYLVDVIEQAQITTLHFVPSMLAAFVDVPDPGRCRSLARVICSGEAISPELLRRYAARIDVPLYNLYGPTEAAVDVSWWRCDAADVRSVVPIGKPIANTELYILDRWLQPLPLGVAGELFIGGAGVGRGYLNRPELTAEKFIADPFSRRAGARLYRTGDLARYRDDGNVEFLGRLDHQVKVRGFRIELGEIEATLLAHSSVRECVVIVREDRPGVKQLVAYVVPRGGVRLVIPDVRGHLAARLPDYMVPPVLVPLADLPRLPNGKLDRHALPPPDALRDRRAVRAARTGITAATPAPAPTAGAAARGVDRYLPPRTDVERTLARLWQDVLEVEPIGVTDNYFELGGDSILALKLVSRIQVEFDRHIPLAHLFAHPTIEQLAAAIHDDADREDWRPLVSIKAGGPEPPLFVLPGAGGNVIYFYRIAHALASPRAVYGLQAVGLDGVTPPLTSIEAIAAMNLDEIRRVQPHGPYFLAGHSFGGRVAFEMCRQLRAQGEAIGLLAILDTPAPLVQPIAEPIEIGGEWQDAHWLAKIAREIEEFFGVSLDVTVDALLPLSLDEQLDLVVERMRRAGWWAPGADHTPLRGFLQVYKANTQTSYVCREPAASIPIALFRTAQSGANAGNTPPEIAALMQQPAWGWEPFSVGPVRVFEVPGDHLSMLADPHVETLARALDAALT